MSRTASSYLIYPFFLFYILFWAAFSTAYLTYLWNILVFSRDFHKVPCSSISFYDLLSYSMTFQ